MQYLARVSLELSLQQFIHFLLPKQLQLAHKMHWEFTTLNKLCSQQ